MADVTPIRGKSIRFHLRDSKDRFNRLKAELNSASTEAVLIKAMLLLDFTRRYRAEGTTLYIFNAEQGDVDALKEIFGNPAHRAEIDEAASGAPMLTMELAHIASGAFDELRQYLSRTFSELSEQGVVVGAILFLELIVERCGDKSSILLLRSPASETRRLDYEEYFQSWG